MNIQGEPYLVCLFGFLKNVRQQLFVIVRAGIDVHAPEPSLIVPEEFEQKGNPCLDAHKTCWVMYAAHGVCFHEGEALIPNLLGPCCLSG